MSSSRQLTITKFIQNITKLPYFTHRWTHLNSLHDVLKTRYKLADMTVKNATINRHLGKTDPNIDNLSYRHESGIYRLKKGKDYYFYFYYSGNDAPKFPPLRIPNHG